MPDVHHTDRILLLDALALDGEQSTRTLATRLGARGYTVTDARGRGSRGVRDANWDEAANIRIEVICSRDIAESLLDHLQQHYYANYAMVACLHEVEVLRAAKF